MARWVTCDDANELKRFIDGNSHRVAHDAVDAPTVLVEYDNSQSNANHIHTVWRDLENDFGGDLLRRHYSRQPHRR